MFHNNLFTFFKYSLFHLKSRLKSLVILIMNVIVIFKILLIIGKL